MNIFDGNVTSADFLDYLRNLVEFGGMISSAAGEEVALNTHIQQTVSAKKARRRAIRDLVSGASPVKKVMKNVIAYKKQDGAKWYIFDATGKKRLAGPFSSEGIADGYLSKVEALLAKKVKASAPEVIPPQLRPAMVYTLSHKVNSFVAWASVQGGPRIKSYASSINTGLTVLARKVGSSLYSSKNSSEVSFTPTFGIRALNDLESSVKVVLSSRLGTEERKIVNGLWNDVTCAKKILKVKYDGGTNGR